MAAVLGLLFAVAALAPAPVITGCAHQPQVRPHEIVIACGDGNFYVDHLAWKRWGAGGAVAAGVAHQNDCTPYCAAGHFHSYRATVTLSRIVSCVKGRREFARVSWQLAAAKPARYSRVGSQTLTCRFLRLRP
jgi:hypothetical protein